MFVKLLIATFILPFIKRKNALILKIMMMIEMLSLESCQVTLSSLGANCAEEKEINVYATDFSSFANVCRLHRGVIHRSMIHAMLNRIDQAL